MGVAAGGAKTCRWRPAARGSDTAWPGTFFGDGGGFAHAGYTRAEFMGVEVVRSGHRIFERPERVAAGPRASPGAAGGPGGVFDLPYLYRSTGEPCSRRGGPVAGGRC